MITSPRRMMMRPRRAMMVRGAMLDAPREDRIGR
jgi:hypothetical protein